MLRPWLWCATSLLAAASPLPGATVLERSVAVEIRPDGTLLERTQLAVRLDSAADLEAWSPYAIYLDEHRRLESLSASFVRPGGTAQAVPKQDLDTSEQAGEGILHSSQRFRLVRFPALPPGAVISLRYAVAERPYFPAGAVELGGADPVEALRVEVRGGAGGLRWRLDGPEAGYTVRQLPGGVEVTASGLAGRAGEGRPMAPPRLEPVLRYGWGPASSWDAVARWYGELARPVPRGSEALRRRARELAAGIGDPHARLAALLDFVRREVRYVAVEVGVGGYRPSPPLEVLERRWGDCKDKTYLLVDLLAEAGIAAFPALVLAADDRRVDPEFADPGQFNHMIVALPADALAAAAAGAVGGGYRFLDPTQTRGGLEWLHPAVQGQHALVVRPDGGELVPVPLAPAHEGSSLEVDAGLTPEGEARGEARLELSGLAGAVLADYAAGARADHLPLELAQLLGRLLPGMELAEVGWSVAEAGVPALEVGAQVRLPGALQPAGAERIVMLPSFEATPPPRELGGETDTLVVRPASSRVVWRLRMPEEGCALEDQQVAVDNRVGSFRQSVSASGTLLTVERRLELRQRWIGPELAAELKELSLAEHRTARRRIRLSCSG